MRSSIIFKITLVFSKMSYQLQMRLQNHNNALEMVTDVLSVDNSWQSDSASLSPFLK